MKHTISKQKSGTRQAFTLVELLIAMVAAAVLALTAGILLFSFNKSIRLSREAVELQRDGAAAMSFFNQVIRETTFAGITNSTLSSVDVSNATLNAWTRFFADQNDLVYDPNLAVPGNNIVLIDNRLESFNHEVDGNTASITIELVLRSGETRSEISSRIKPRNK